MKTGGIYAKKVGLDYFWTVFRLFLDQLAQNWRKTGGFIS
jgi:hypothetical protein